MKWLVATIASMLVALTIASAAVAGIYSGPRQWYAGQSAATGFSTSWLANWFATYGSGYDKTVTFIDNKSYGWHNTVRNKSSYTETYPPGALTVKAYCLAHVSGFWGSCSVR
jgi:hypothetical protein